MTAQSPDPARSHARAQTIAGLRALADYLEANPAVPIAEPGGEYNIIADHGDDATERAEIDSIAAVLGEPVYDETADYGHYWVTKVFGRITYRATHIPVRQRAIYRALDDLARSVHEIYTDDQ